MSRRLLVTGGSGFLGSRVVAAATAQGWDVVAPAHRGPGRRLDVSRRDDVRRLVRDVAPQAVVHTAYVKDDETVTVSGSHAVALACADLGTRLVHVSSDVVFSGAAGRPYVEADQADPVNPYGRAKAAAERLVLGSHPSAVVVRTSLLLGGPARPGVHELHATVAAAVFWADVVRCPVVADDVAAAMVELAGLDYAGPLHVAGPQAMSRVELAGVVTGSAVAGQRAPAGQPLDVRLDSGMAGELLTTRLRGPGEVWRSAGPTTGLGLHLG